ncbi:Mitochondrial translocator assembly and maintenance protein 41 [Dimargaris cristalligena]|uniref:Phosphatidate cytidylyltransferase, mitochondrial n=1 Tax=Dimargaris cristalligena TaxID=215637 RepID=A0A4P9ZY24_9FUNG|nr:Mitochondrial translocator assembly and maintenance protein 41 [Dimargaris cristalligena]RKP37822.1 mitochondrial matrix Mmp37 [Dimargaris cristalligena]|eukprot:RKP37822.1 mitochondrial matrix Mmp37 [Dimargaris cristalligena]
MYQLAEPGTPLHEIVGQFRAPVRFAFGYGSSVFKQARQEKGNESLVDVILAVTHPQHWHSLNMQQNPHHYSALRLLGSAAVNYVQDQIGAGVYFNPYVNINGMRLKYGVVSLSTLCSDLVNWDTLYLAGRMQKPIMVLKNDSVINITGQVNLTNAVRVALLQLPASFTEEQFFTKVVALSYTGDPRMRLGENPDKVRHIVQGQLPELRNVYQSVLRGMSNVSVPATGGAAGYPLIQQDLHPTTMARMVRHLPGTFYYRLTRQFQKQDPSVFATPPASPLAATTEPDDWDHLAAQRHVSLGMVQSPALAACTQGAIQATVRGPALTQSLKGVLTAGIGRSIRYSLDKLRRSRRI